MTVKEFIGDKAVYDPAAQVIFGRRGDNLQMITSFNADVRGWGAIQNLFKTQEEAMAFQDALGQFITRAINAAMANIPSDEEIRSVAVDESSGHDWDDLRYRPVYQDGYEDGAKWMRSKLSVEAQQ